MEIQIIDAAKKAEEIKSDCCSSDVWVVHFSLDED